MNSPELKIQHQCFLLLQKCGIFCHSVPNEAYGRSAIAQTQLVSAGLVPGVADMIVWWPSKEWVKEGNVPRHKQSPYPVTLGYVEYKTPTGRQSDKQKAFMSLCEAHGIEYTVIRSVSDMEELIGRHMNVEEEV